MVSEAVTKAVIRGSGFVIRKSNPEPRFTNHASRTTRFCKWTIFATHFVFFSRIRHSR